MNDQWGDLISAVLDGSPSPEVAAQVNAWIKADPANVRRFVREAILHSHLRDLLDGAEALRRDEEDRRSLMLSESMVLPAVIEEAGPNQDIDEDEPTDEPEEEESSPPREAARWSSLMQSLLRPRWQLIAAAIVPLLLAIGVYRLIRSPQRLATLAASFDAQWDAPNGAPKPGQAMPSDLLYLRSGVAEIRYESGAAMIVEGPARFQIRSANAAELTFGKATASVPPPAQGFTIEAGSTRVVDLGTEFGVEVSADGSDAIQVFKGTVRLEPRSGNSSTTLVLTEGQAANATGTDLKIDPAGVQPQRFVRHIGGEMALDVVDLICGGDGSTRRRGMDINPKGQVGVFKQIADVTGDHLYHRITGTSVLDGCFVPEGSRGPVQVDSASHAFAFPGTSNKSLENICTGGPIPPLSGKGAPLLAQYAGPEHSVLYMVANRGLTLDLAAVRRLHPGAGLANFHCLVSSILPDAPRHAKTILYIIADGEQRFQKIFTNLDGVFPIEAALRPDDRFLTLAITEGSDGLVDVGTMVADASLVTGDGATLTRAAP